LLDLQILLHLLNFLKEKIEPALHNREKTIKKKGENSEEKERMSDL